MGGRQGILRIWSLHLLCPLAHTILNVDAVSRRDCTINRQKQAQEILEAPGASRHSGSTILQGDKGREGFAKKAITVISPGRGTPGEALRELGLE